MSKLDFYGQKPKKPYFAYQALIGLAIGAVAAIAYFISEFFK
ncbi:MAG: hypothetical protein ACEQSR_01435 [Candidatus Methylacidiphilales bacterium]